MDEFYDIPSTEGKYKINKEGVILNKNRDKIRPWLDNSGHTKYLVVELYINGEGKKFRLHRLLAMTFIPNPLKYPVVRHLNDISTDNRIENLAWGTNRHNIEDAKRNGKTKKPKGENSKCFGKTRPYAKGVRIILDTQTGIYYFGCGEAGKAKGINVNTLRSKLNGFERNNTSLVFA